MRWNFVSVFPFVPTLECVDGENTKKKHVVDAPSVSKFKIFSCVAVWAVVYVGNKSNDWDDCWLCERIPLMIANTRADLMQKLSRWICNMIERSRLFSVSLLTLRMLMNYEVACFQICVLIWSKQIFLNPNLLDVNKTTDSRFTVSARLTCCCLLLLI